MDSLCFSDPAPWPPVPSAAPSLHDAERMLYDLGSCRSEMSAVGLYVYNSVLTRERFPDVSEAFRRISVVEMHHLGLFARLSLLLGADPRLWSGPPRQLRWWSPACLSYPRELTPLLQNALHGERDTVALYRQQAARVRDPALSALLERVILDEKRHIEVFEALLREKA